MFGSTEEVNTVNSSMDDPLLNGRSSNMSYKQMDAMMQTVLSGGKSTVITK
jgi:hypothetical protein